MFGLTRWSPFDDMLPFHRDVDRLFNQFWSELPDRTSSAPAPGFQVIRNDDAWKVRVALPGVDPQHVQIEVAGNTLMIRAEQPGDNTEPFARFEQTMTVPQFLDLDQVTASHRHGLLELTLPLKESVKPRRIQIEHATGDQKKLNAAA